MDDSHEHDEDRDEQDARDQPQVVARDEVGDVDVRAGMQAQVVGPQNGPLLAGVATPATANVAVTGTVRTAAQNPTR
jgi:hypothetical protein